MFEIQVKYDDSKIYSQSVCCTFDFLMVFFEEQIVVILMTYNLPFFFFLFIAYILGITRINIRVNFHQVIWKHESERK